MNNTFSQGLTDELFWRTPPGVTRNYRQGRFGQLHYRLAIPELLSKDIASGKAPLLFLHSIPNSSRIYNRLLAEMGRDRLAIAVDTPGFGLSDQPPFTPTIDDYSACIGDFIRELGEEFEFERVDLFGYHFGSKIAMILARQQPTFIRRLVLVSAPIYTKRELAEEELSLNAPRPDQSPADGADLKRDWQKSWNNRDELTGAWFVQREIAEGLANSAQVHQANLAAFSVQHAEQLPLINHPLLVICPGDDLWLRSLRAKSLIRNGQFVERKHWSNGFLDVRTVECALLLRDFLDTGADDHQPDTQPLTAPIAKDGNSSNLLDRRGFHAGSHGALHYRLASEPEVRNQRQPGRPIVLLHMSPNSSRVFDSLVKSLSSSRPVLAVDTPGFGESEAPPQPIGIEQFAVATLELIKALGFIEVDVLGYHTGSMTAIELALIAPDCIKHVVQISSPIYTAQEQQAAGQLYRARELQVDGQHLVDAWQNMQKFYTKDVPRTVLRRNFTASLRGGPMSHWGHQAAFTYPLAIKLPLVEQPVLVINPEDDLVDKTRRAEPLLQRGRIHDLPGRAHGFIDQMTEEFTQLLKYFLDES